MEETPKKGSEPTTRLSFRNCEDRAAMHKFQGKRLMFGDF
jgi:hypothetical protein